MDTRIREKVGAMLALADDAANEHEAATALAMAQKLLLEHNMSLHAFRAEDAPAQTAKPFELDIAAGGAWRVQLLGAVAVGNLCTVVQGKGEGGRASKHAWVFGAPVNVGLVVQVYDWLGETLERLAHEQSQERIAAYRELYGIGPRDTRSFKTSFYQSAVMQIAKRLQDALHEAQSTDQTRALVVVGDQARKDASAHFGGRLRPARRANSSNSDGRAAGRETGQGMNLSRPAAVTSGARRLA